MAIELRGFDDLITDLTAMAMSLENGSGVDLMMGSPSIVDEDQLADAHIAVVEDD